MTIRILIVDDHARVRAGLRLILEEQQDFQVVGEAVNGREGTAMALALNPDVIIMDVNMPVLNGIEATRLLCERSPLVKILILSFDHSRENFLRALRYGARGCLLKDSAADEVVTAVRSIMEGTLFFGAGIVRPHSRAAAGAPP